MHTFQSFAPDQAMRVSTLTHLPETADQGLETLPTANSETSQLYKGNILLIDDQSGSHLFNQLLLEIGYQVTVAMEELESLSVDETSLNDCSLVIIDLTMPRQLADRLIENIRTVESKVPIIACAGYGGGVNEMSIQKMDIQKLLYKPISKSQIETAINELLQGVEDTSFIADRLAS